MTATAERPAPEIGKDRRRKEDQRLITGRTRWTDNIALPGMLHLAMVRSPFAHATIVSIDTSAAKAATNVVAVFTGKDLGEEQGVIANAWPITTEQVTPNHLPMPPDRVAFAGEIVAVVVARTAAEARDAAELVDVEYDELPAALDLQRGRRGQGARPPRPRHQQDRLLAARLRSARAPAATSTRPSPRRAPTASSSSGSIRQQRLIPAFMEPRSTVVDPTGEQITMWSATQIPHITRFLLAATTGVPESKIRVIAPDVGGGFGGKLQTTPEEWITWSVARRIGKPCKYTETRSESLVSAHHGRDHWQKLTLAATKEGKVTGLKVDLLADLGAYVGIVGGGVPVLGAWMFNAIYKFDAYQFNCTPVLTNKTWVDAYRGAGRPEATYAIERMMDELAAEVGKDPLEIREKNWIKHEEFPFTTVAGMTYDSGNYEAATAKAKEMFGYDALRAEQKARRDRGTRSSSASASRRSPRCADWRPAGCSARSTTAPAAGSTPPCGCCRPARSRSSPARARTARATRRRSARSSPTGSECRSRTSRSCTATPRSRHKGLDTYGSRSLVVGGEALVKAADKVIEKAKPIAAHLLEANVDDLEFSGGRFSVKGTDQGMASPRSRWRPSRRTTTRRASSRASTPRRPTTRSTSPSRTARTCARWRSTPRPARSRCASTSASTTSATSSTR